MKTIVIKTESQLEAALDKNRTLVVDGNLRVSVDIFYSSNIQSIIVSGDAEFRGYAKVSCILGFRFGKKFRIENGVVPAQCSAWDREFWGERFGIDTSTGCWDEFAARLSAVAPKLLRKKHWLPIEKLMIESCAGKYKNVEIPEGV